MLVMRYPNTLASCSHCDTFLAPGATSCPTCGASRGPSLAMRTATVAVVAMGLTAAAMTGCGDDGSTSGTSTGGAGGAGGDEVGSAYGAGPSVGGSTAENSVASAYGVGPTGSGGNTTAGAGGAGGAGGGN